MKKTKWVAMLLAAFIATPLFAEEVDKDTPKQIAEPEALETIAADIPRYTEPFTIKFKNEATLKIYGRIEMLSYFDTTQPFVSDWLIYVHPDNVYRGSHASYSMSVRGSPFGFHFTVPKVTKMFDLNARLEMDFSGGFTTGAGSVYSPLVRLKQAWFSLDSEHLSLLAGQTFALIAPLFPDISPWIALGTSGNPWIRLPQIKATTKFNPVMFEFSINRPMAANEVFGNQLDDFISDGEISKMPFFMGRLSYNKKWENLELATGASGVYGREKIHRQDAATGQDVNKTLPVWFAGYDLKIITKYIDLLAEAFIGDNLNTFFGGVLQGVNVTLDNAYAIRSMGGWGQLTFKPLKQIFFNIGAGIDHPKNADLTATQRTSNFTAYGNANYILGKWLRFALEPSYTRTAYKDNTTNYNFRGLLRTSFIF